MASHLVLLSVFAFFVSIVFGALLRDEPRQQVRLAATLFGVLVGAAVVVGWLMYPFPR